MRLRLSFLALIACWLLVPAPAAAAERSPAESTHAATRCRAHRTSFGHHPRRLGPLAQSIAERAGLAETLATIHAGLRGSDDDDDAAIQDDAPAARIDADSGTPALEPLGTLTASGFTLPAHRILTRRSPRGPPVHLT